MIDDEQLANRMPKNEMVLICFFFPAVFFLIVQIMFTLIGSMIEVHVHFERKIEKARVVRQLSCN